LSWPPTSHTVKLMFLYSTVSTLNPEGQAGAGESGSTTQQEHKQRRAPPWAAGRQPPNEAQAVFASPTRVPRPQNRPGALFRAAQRGARRVQARRRVRVQRQRTDCGNGGHDLAQLELVKDSGLTRRIQPDLHTTK
jgi:hypothetical protein